MAISDAERQRKHREKMRGLNLSCVHVWVPKEGLLRLNRLL
jgi:hypothetical protein